MICVLGKGNESKEELRLSKHNYSQYSNKNKTANNNRKPVPKEAPVSKVEAVPTALVVEPMVETVETVVLNEPVMGVVVDCAKLNVRVKPSAYAEVLCVLDTMTKVEIDVANSTVEWFKICTAAGLEGYCMRKYIDAHL